MLAGLHVAEPARLALELREAGGDAEPVLEGVLLREQRMDLRPSRRELVTRLQVRVQRLDVEEADDGERADREPAADDRRAGVAAAQRHSAAFATTPDLPTNRACRDGERSEMFQPMRRRSRPRVGRVLVATDRSATAEHAVEWAAELAERYEAELVVLQVVLDANEATDIARAELAQRATELAEARGRAELVVGDDPSRAIVEAAEREQADVVVVGNRGMSGRKEFLLGNVPNRVSHGVRTTVVIVNTAGADEPGGLFRRSR